MNRPRGTQLILMTLLGGCLAAGVDAQDEKAQDKRPTDERAQRFLLAFDPPRNKILEVKYHQDMQWVYEKDNCGKLTTELLLHWRFEDAKKPGLLQAVGTFQSVVYRGSGGKNGKEWNYDVHWTQTKGYLKGKDSKAVTTWVGGEIKEGIRFTLDKRGAANPGVC